MLLSKGNHKLPRDVAIWNLPHGSTCPGATAMCKKYCYAFKAERFRKQVLPFRKHNFLLSLRPDFPEMIINQLKRLRVVRAVRIHESGDFYNQAYLDKWVTIAKACPDITFTAYTKSLHLDFSKFKRLRNVILFASVDPTTPPCMLASNTIRRKAVVIDRHADKAPKGYFLCPGSCKKCSHCYTRGCSSVAFREH